MTINNELAKLINNRVCYIPCSKGILDAEITTYEQVLSESSLATKTIKESKATKSIENKKKGNTLIQPVIERENQHLENNYLYKIFSIKKKKKIRRKNEKYHIIIQSADVKIQSNSIVGTQFKTIQNNVAL